MAVFVLLVMLLGMSVGLSVMSRSLQDLKSTTTSDQSSRAFSAAEAGLEVALATDLSATSGNVTINNVNVHYDVVATPNTFTATITKDDVGQIELAGNTNPITISWGDAGSGCNLADNGDPAMELNLYTYNVGSQVYGLKKYAYNPYNCSGNDFSVAGAGSGFRSTVTITPSADAKLLRLKPIYNNATVQVTGTFGPQTYQITSKGTTTTGVARAVQIYKTKPALPPLFDYVLFGGSGSVSQ